MKTQIKHLIVVLVVTVLLAGCAGSLPNKTSAQDVAKAAANIADFTLPEEYQPEYTLTLAGFTIVSYNPAGGYSHLFLVQAPADYKEDQAKLEETLHQAQSGKKDDTTRMTVVEKRSVAIRGQQTTPGHQRRRQFQRPAVPPGHRHLPGQERPGAAGDFRTGRALGHRSHRPVHRFHKVIGRSEPKDYSDARQTAHL